MNYFSNVMYQLIINIMLDGKNMGNNLLIDSPTEVNVFIPWNTSKIIIEQLPLYLELIFSCHALGLFYWVHDNFASKSFIRR
jgi:hypothetical protein